MPTAVTRILLSLLLLLPLAAHAGDAQDFVTANPAKQASLLERWSAAPEAARLPLLEALQQGRVAADSAKTAFIETAGNYQAAEGEAQPLDTPKKLRLNNRLRGLIATAVASHQLLVDDPVLRLAAAQQLQKSAKPAQLQLLNAQVASETDDAVRDALTLALANLQLVDSDLAVRLAAVRLLGETGDPLARTRLETLLDPAVESDPTVRTAAETSLAQVKRKLLIGELLGQAFSGLSLGSILLLAALGLAITFGLLGVINMAHGEMLMLGAYTTYVVQLLFQRLHRLGLRNADVWASREVRTQQTAQFMFGKAIATQGWLNQCDHTFASNAFAHKQPGRNLVLLFDGTGNILGNQQDTNVVKLLRMLGKGHDPSGKEPTQLVYYDPGVGTTNEFPADGIVSEAKNQLRQLAGLALGNGVFPNIAEAYRFLVNTYQRGDRIYLFGFSRGAYTVRSLAGLLRKIRTEARLPRQTQQLRVQPAAVAAREKHKGFEGQG